MKRTLPLILSVFMAFSVTGQPPDLKTRMISARKADFSNDRHGFSDINKRNVRPYLNLPGQHQTSGLKLKSQAIMALDSIYVERLDMATGQLDYSSKYVFFYDPGGKQTKEIIYDREDDGWEPDMMEEFSYDQNGNLSEILISAWDPYMEDWLPYEKEEYSYDNNNNMSAITTYDWDQYEEAWDPRWKDEFTYDATGNMVGEISYTYSTEESEWLPDWKNEITWDDNRNLVEVITYDWDYDLMEWVPDNKFGFLYDSSGNNTEIITSEWDTDWEEWMPEWKIINTFDANGRITQEESSLYDPDIEEWDPYLKNEYHYDDSGNRTQQVTYYTDSYPDWEPALMYEYVVDGSYTKDEVNTPLYFSILYDFPNILIEMVQSVHDGDSWRQWEKTTLYYSEYDPPDDPATFTLTISQEGNGTVEVNGTAYTEAISFEQDTEITLEAVPHQDYKFVEWTGDLASDEQVETIVMDGNKNITVIFSIATSSVLLVPAGIDIYPNPFSSSITVSNADQPGVITITNLIGQKVKEFNLKGHGSNTIPTDDLDDGIYLLIFKPVFGEQVVIRMVKN